MQPETATPLGLIPVAGSLPLSVLAIAKTYAEAISAGDWSGGPVLCQGDCPVGGRHLAVTEYTGDEAWTLRAARNHPHGIAIAISTLADAIATPILLEQLGKAGVQPKCLLIQLDEFTALRRLTHVGTLCSLKAVRDVCQAREIPVAITGKAALDREHLPLWLGLGFRNWAGTQADALELRQVIASLPLTEAAVANLHMIWPEVQEQPSARAVRQYIKRAWVRE